MILLSSCVCYSYCSGHKITDGKQLAIKFRQATGKPISFSGSDAGRYAGTVCSIKPLCPSLLPTIIWGDFILGDSDTDSIAELGDRPVASLKTAASRSCKPGATVQDVVSTQPKKKETTAAFDCSHKA